MSFKVRDEVEIEVEVECEIAIVVSARDLRIRKRIASSTSRYE